MTWHTIKINCIKFQTVDPEICSIFIFLENGLGLVFPTHIVYDFCRKIFLILCSINWPNFIVCSSLPLEILANTCFVISCLPVYDVFEFENNLSFLIKLFFYTAKTPRQKFEYLQDKNKFKVNLKAVFIIFKGLLVARNWLRPLSGPLKVHSPHAGIFLFNSTLLYFWLSNEIFFCWTRSTQCDNTYLNKVWPEFCVTFFICVRLMKVSSNIRKLRRSRS